MGYQGLKIPIPIGNGGLDKSLNRSGVPINRLIEATNTEIFDGFVGKEGGSSHQNSTAITGTPAILRGHDYFPDASTQRGLVALSNGVLRKDDGTFAWATSLGTFATTDQITTISEGGVETSGNAKHVFFCNGADSPFVLDDDGATVGAITGPAADWATTQPVKMLVYGLWNWAIADHFLYRSDPADHESFTGASTSIFEVFPGEGTRLISMIGIFGRIYMFKEPSGLYYLDIADVSDETKWSLNKVSDNISCAGPNSIASTKNEAVFVSATGGLHFLTGAESFGDVKDSDITAILNIEDVFRTGADKTRLNRAQIAYYEDKKQVWVCFTSSTGTRNDRILKIDISDVSNLKAWVSDKDECESIWIRKDATTGQRKPLLGGKDGFVWTTDETTFNVNSTSYNARFQIPFTDFSFFDPNLANVDKILDAVEVHAQPSGDHDITLQIFIDGDLRDTLTFNMGATGAALGSFVLGTDRLDGSGLITKKKRAAGFGQRFSYSIFNSGLNEGYNIDKIVSYVRPAGERGRV